MIKHVFINKDKLQLILSGNKNQLRQPVGFCYDNGQPRTMFIGTKRDNSEEVHLTKGGDLQFNLKPAKEAEKEEVEASPPEGTMGERVDARLANDAPVDTWNAEDTSVDQDIPF